MKLRTARRAALAALLSAVAGCTAADGYELVRDAGEAKAECDRELTVDAQRDCEAAYRQSFETYQAERRAVLESEAEAVPR